MRRAAFCLHAAVLAVMPIVCADVAAADGVPSIVLVKNGRAMADIVVPADALPRGEAVYPPLDYPKEPRVIANFLADTIHKSTGARLPVCAETERDPDEVAIHCGWTTFASGLSLDVDDMDEDEFLIAFPDERNIVIAAKYQHGVEWGACEFLERYVGARWLFAGDLGEHVPEQRDLVLPGTEVRDKPVFLTRSIAFDNSRKDLTIWSRRMRLRRRVKYHHYLGVLIHPKRYTKTHPQFFPIQNGRRLLPESFIAWQPCFSATGIADTAVANINQYFRSHPLARTYSLGVNDVGGHCECETCLATDGDRTNYCGLRDRSNGYYAFCNAVATGVTKEFPGRKFGFLAYSNVAEPPGDGASLHPALVPFITYDRMKWVAPGIEAKGHAVTQMWTDYCAEIGWYDYIYGKWYAVPRVWFHKMADYLCYGRENRVRHFTAEAYISDNYREGPKFYLAMKLLWNPDLDVDAVLRDWYECAVGADAAPYLERYFAFWEDFWSRRIPDSEWFRESGDKTYLEYHDTRYFRVLGETDCRTCERLLRDTLKLARTLRQKARAQLYLDGLLAAKEIVLSSNAFESLNRRRADARVLDVLHRAAFDRDVEGWGTWKNTYSNARFSWDGGEGHDAPGAVLIDRTDDATATTVSGVVYMKNLPVQRGATYRLAVWAKTDGVQPGADIHIRTRWREKDGRTWVNFMTMTRKQQLADFQPRAWQKIEILLRVPDDPRIAYLTCLLTVDKTNTGKTWFDDFEMAHVVLPTVGAAR